APPGLRSPLAASPPAAKPPHRFELFPCSSCAILPAASFGSKSLRLLSLLKHCNHSTPGFLLQYLQLPKAPSARFALRHPCISVSIHGSQFLCLPQTTKLPQVHSAIQNSPF